MRGAEETMRRSLGGIWTCVALLAVATALSPAHANEKLRVAKVVPFAWTFTPLDIGMQAGIFAKHGLDIEASPSSGAAKLQQLIAPGSVDIGIGSGPGMAFIVKGVPAKAVAEIDAAGGDELLQ